MIRFPDCPRAILHKNCGRNSVNLATLSARPRFTGDGGVDREEIHHQQLVPRHLVAPDFLAGYSNRRLDHRRRHRHGHSRQSLVAPPPPNSQSSSPVTTGSSPEAAAVAGEHTQLTTSPASPPPPIGEEDEFEIEPLRPLSILRSSSSASWGVATLSKFLVVHPDLYQNLVSAHDKSL